MEPTTTNATGKIVTAFIIGLVIGFAAGTFWQNRRTERLSVLPAQTEETAESEKVRNEKGVEENTVPIAEKTETEATTSVSVISVIDQTAGGSVLVRSITASEPVWVAVREVSAGGGLGNILGAQKAFVDNQKDITVELLRPTKAGEKYVVVLYRDIGAPAFNYREDVLLEGAKATFTAQ